MYVKLWFSLYFKKFLPLNPYNSPMGSILQVLLVMVGVLCDYWWLCQIQGYDCGFSCCFSGSN